MKILVTGGAGFIGSHIVDKLIEQNYEVLIIDNLSTGKKNNINPKAKFFELDINDIKLTKVFEEERPDYVIHQAAQISVVNSVQDPIFDAKINILGTLNLLENCKKFKVKKIIYANSGGAGSGEPQYFPIDEEHPINPLCPYGVSKHTVEHYLYLYSHLYNLKYTSLRYANVYGPRQDPFGEGGVVAIFSHKLLNNQIPKIFGDGEQTRDFVYVKDVAEANILAIKKGDNNYFNVGTGKETSVNELYKLIKEICNSKIEANHVEARKGELKKSVLDINKIRTSLNWQPKTELKDGLKETVKFFQNE